MSKNTVNVKVFKDDKNLVISNDRNAIWNITLLGSGSASYLLASMVGATVAEFFDDLDNTKECFEFTLTLKKL